MSTVTIVPTTVVAMSIKNNDFYSAIHALIRTGHWITDQVGVVLKEFDISEPQYNVLRILKERKNKPITVFEIQELMVQRTSNVTRIIDKLLSKTLVSRTECPTNRRKMDIVITNNGLDLLKKLDRRVDAFHEPLKNNLTDTEVKTLMQLILKLKKGTNK